MCVLWSYADDELERGRNAPVQARGAEDAAAHIATLLRVQGHMGLGDPVPDVLHGHHGAVQRGVQEQDQRGRVPAGGRLHRRRHILHRHRAQLPHHVRRSRRRGGLRPEGHPDELSPVVVRHRPVVLSAVRRVQRVRSRRRGELSACNCNVIPTTILLLFASTTFFCRGFAFTYPIGKTAYRFTALIRLEVSYSVSQ